MTIHLGDNVSFTSTEYGGVLLDQKAGQYWQLNGVGALALRTMLDGGDTTAAASAVCEVYDTAEDNAVTDINALLVDLRVGGLVRSVRGRDW
jgi:hypothetical protein